LKRSRKVEVKDDLLRSEESHVPREVPIMIVLATVYSQIQLVLIDLGVLARNKDPIRKLNSDNPIASYRCHRGGQVLRFIEGQHQIWKTVKSTKR
jgi:hypothetical protein